MTSFAVSSGRRVPFHASTCFLIGSKFRCMRSTPTERMSTRLKCLVCLASTGVNTPGTMLPSWNKSARPSKRAATARLADCASAGVAGRSEEHTSELQSPCNLVCRLLLEKKKKNELKIIILKKKKIKKNK